jgi:hypothetical protein
MNETLFASWVRALGFNKKQIRDAGAKIGLNASSSGFRNRAEVLLSASEKLAMTAAWLGIPSWKRDFAELAPKQRKRVMRAAKLIQDTLSGQEPAPRKDGRPEAPAPRASRSPEL